MEYLSPAKINLFLRVLGRRDDGYHEIATLMHAVALYDRLTIEEAASDTLTCSDPTLPTDGRNLVLKAAELFRKRSGVPLYINVHLEKNIPHQAGLGGGSSNAATTLWAMNELAGTCATAEELQRWAAEIGSDISFFLSGGSAYCTGRGEQIRDVAIPVEERLVTLRKPEAGAPTAPVFAALDATALPCRDPLQALSAFERGEFLCFNDLEVAAETVVPEVGSVRRQLIQEGLSPVMMSGAGSTVYGLRPCSNTPKVDPMTVSFVTRRPNQWYTDPT